MHVHQATNALGIAVARKVKAVNVEAKLVQLGNELLVLVHVSGGVFTEPVLQQDVGFWILCRPHKGCNIEI